MIYTVVEYFLGLERSLFNGLIEFSYLNFSNLSIADSRDVVMLTHSVRSPYPLKYLFFYSQNSNIASLTKVV